MKYRDRNIKKGRWDMVRVVIYGEQPAEVKGLETMLREILTENRRWPMIHTYIGDLDGYLHFVRGNPYLIMLASVQGKQGVKIVEKIRENNPAASLIWLSDRDNALESWRLHVAAFGVLPTKKEELEELLAACSESLLERTGENERRGRA